ncbi:hypothetical protein ATANTOWER_000973 [Ataeniobius toweri]|uniref:Uncharacterized protein n=1 Tax=Ataeniobius toweri TaxID=208326 RepID=A0ABU7AVR4_9TELE|nr:hypothetical protein [Ataeniobius toweri]
MSDPNNPEEVHGEDSGGPAPEGNKDKGKGKEKGKGHGEEGHGHGQGGRGGSHGRGGRGGGHGQGGRGDFKHGSGSIMLWGFRSSLRQRQAAKDLRPKWRLTFQQVNEPKLTARAREADTHGGDTDFKHKFSHFGVSFHQEDNMSDCKCDFSGICSDKKKKHKSGSDDSGSESDGSGGGKGKKKDKGKRKDKNKGKDKGSSEKGKGHKKGGKS